MAVSRMISLEAMLFLQSVAAGGAIWLLYDVLVVFRKVIPHNIHVINLEDFLYWIFTGIAVCYLMFRSNEGLIRGFSIVGMFLGAFFYHETVSRIFVKVMTFLFLHLSRIIKRIFLILAKPFLRLKLLLRKVKRATIEKKRKKEQDAREKKEKKKKNSHKKSPKRHRNPKRRTDSERDCLDSDAKRAADKQRLSGDRERITGNERAGKRARKRDRRVERKNYNG